MASKSEFSMNDWKKKWTRWGAGMALLALTGLAVPQDYQGLMSTPGRSGLPSLAPSTPGATSSQVYNDFGRGFLRWWDPADLSRAAIDNDEPGSTAVPLANWNQPLPTTLVRASFAVIGTGAAYRYATTQAATSNTDPTAGATSAYVWNFTGLTAGQEYELRVNLPVGPTDLGGGAPLNLWFPQKYYVYRVNGAVGGPVTDVVDADLFNGSVRLGNGGADTSVVFVPTGTTLTLTLFNTAPRRADGGFRDPNAQPGQQLVYADEASLSGAGPLAGRYVAQPVVHEVQVNPGGGAVQFPRRTFAARIEESFLGALNRTYNMGVVTSYTYDSERVDLPGNFGEPSIAWSWPVQRPLDASTTERQRYANDLSAYVSGPIPANVGIRRGDQRVVVDDLNGGATASPQFAPAGPGVLTGFYGVNAQISPIATLPGTLGRVAYFPTLRPATYQVDVFIPPVSLLPLARNVDIEIYQGATLIDTVQIDQTAASGWVRLPSPGALGYDSLLAQPLNVQIMNSSNNDVGRFVVADAVRFVTQSDLSISSTPLARFTQVRAPGLVNRDVMIVARENGTIAAIDAHGEVNTGNAPQTYWTYPREIPAGDANDDVTQDGPDRIAEAPTGFDASSPAVANIAGQDALYVTARNGKVYSLDMAGRGDGSTTRRWTWPNDYDPTNPTLNHQPGLPVAPGRQFGSVAIANAGIGDLVIVPTPEGRVYALDAVGNTVTRTTTVQWAQPALAATPYGPIESAPVVDQANGRIYITSARGQLAGDLAFGRVTAIDMNTGAELWTVTGTTVGTTVDFGAFGKVSPLFVPGSQVTGPGGAFVGQDILYVMDQSGQFAALDPATGNTLFRTFELAAAGGGNMTFLYGTVYNNVGALQNDVPMVMVPLSTGRIVGLLCDGSVNRQGNRSVTSTTLTGTLNAGLAAGGWQTGDPQSWMYANDESGFLYAFNSIDDFNIFGLRPGTPPGFQDISENDPDFENLRDAIQPGNFNLITPQDFETLQQAYEAGTLTQAQVDAAKANVTRRTFEFGETLHVMIDQLPVLGGQPYTVQLRHQGNANSNNQRGLAIRQIVPGTYNAGTDRIVLEQIPMLPTGGLSVVSGKNFLRARAVFTGNAAGSGPEVALPKPASLPVDPTYDYIVANPLAIATLNNAFGVQFSAGLSTDVTQPLVTRNGTRGTDQFPTGTASDLQPQAPLGALGPAKNAKGDVVGHGTQGLSELIATDRSLLTLLFGPTRGLSGVKMAPDDTRWRNDGSADGGVFRPLTDNVGVNYLNLEDYPVLSPNRSLDYPDIRRDNLSAAKEINGETENPLFGNGVTLSPPAYTAPNFTAYRSTDYNNNTTLTRTLAPTQFDLFLGVPNYQPPAAIGYRGDHVVFVDNGSRTGFSPASQSYRNFFLQLNVAVDQRVAMATPTVDLGALPTGSGFKNGAVAANNYPWAVGTGFTPWNTEFNQNPLAPLGGFASHDQYEAMGVVNEGNVNLLNLRVAKMFTEVTGLRPVELYGSNMQDMGWFDAATTVISTLDARYAPSRLVPLTDAGSDLQGRVILQKPRPGDPGPTRLSMNPIRRANPFLRASQGVLYNPATIPSIDAQISTAVPFGAPSGQYTRKMYVFEDDVTNNIPDQITGLTLPVMATTEVFSQPGFTFSFTVREARVTNTATTKGTTVVERLFNTAPNFQWTNTHPSVTRFLDGSVFLAWASNRKDNGNNPAYNPGPVNPANLTVADTSRIFVANTTPGATNYPTYTESPMRDFLDFLSLPSFMQDSTGVALPSAPVTTVLPVPTGFTLNAPTASFDAAAFPSAGTTTNQIPLAYRGRGQFTDGAGNTRNGSWIVLDSMERNGTGLSTVNTATVPDDPQTEKSRPSVVVASGTAIVYYMTSSNNGAALNFSVLNGAVMTPPARIELQDVFSQIGAPSVTTRVVQGALRHEVAVTGVVRGRQNSDVYFGQVATRGGGIPDFRGGFRPFSTRVERITLDRNSGKFWAPGILWSLDRGAITPTNGGRIDIFRRDNTGAFVSILDPAGDYTGDRETGLVKADTVLGGEVLIDTRSGSVTFSGATIPSNMALFVQYRPTLVRVNAINGANYRSVASVHDPRSPAFQVFPLNPQRNRTAELTYWRQPGGTQAVPGDALRMDRTTLGVTRTSNDGTGTTRPYTFTLRPGVKLPTDIATAPDGTPLFMQVTFPGAVPFGERFHQLDPSAGKIYMMGGAEGQTVQVTYRGVDATGNVLAANITVDLVVEPLLEMDETAVPIDQALGESALSLGLDNFGAVGQGRPNLIWMAWASTRAGTPDIYIQTYGPRYAPLVPGN